MANAIFVNFLLTVFRLKFEYQKELETLVVQKPSMLPITLNLLSFFNVKIGYLNSTFARMKFKELDEGK